MDVPLSILFLAVIVVLAAIPVFIIFFHYLKEHKTKIH